jgi:urease accessory protein UreF
MLDQTTSLQQRATEILGDLNAFAEQLGGAESLGQVPLAASSWEGARIANPRALSAFLEHYASNVLIAHELPAVSRAYHHATRYELRELLAFDCELASVPVLRPFMPASRAVGQLQLRRLLPLKDERMVQRYIRAVDAGEANAWHTVVFGLVLTLYSLPLRQGLSHFAQQTLNGFIEAAANSAQISENHARQLRVAHREIVGKAVEQIIRGPGQAPFKPE